MRLVVLALTLHLGTARDEHPGGDRWFSADKAKHFFLSAFIESASYGALRTTGLSHATSLAGATAVTFAAGAGKEIRDARTGGSASVKDMTWNVAGAAAASALVSASRR